MSISTLPTLNTDDEAAVKLRVSPATVFRLRKGRKLGFTRIGGKVYVTDDHIAEYIKGNECAATWTGGTEAPIGTFTSTASAPDKSAELALARQIAGRQRGS